MTMRLLVIAVLALGGAAVGCGGGAGPATSPFTPFGNDPSNASSEPAGSSNETPGRTGGGQSVAQLCAGDCTRIATACPSAAMANCVSSCEADAQLYPSCATQLQAFLTCYATASLTCASDGSVQASGCTAAAQALVTCISPGS